MTQSNDQTAGVETRLTRHGRVSYLEIPALDAQVSAAFYEQVFGWSVAARDGGAFAFEDVSDGLIGHWVTDRAVVREPAIVPYIYVDDIDGTLAEITAHGGEIVRPVYAEGELWVATIRDPAGNVIGVWQAGSR